MRSQRDVQVNHLPKSKNIIRIFGFVMLFAPRTIESQGACFCRYLWLVAAGLIHVRSRRSPRDVGTEPLLYPPFRGSGVVFRRRIFHSRHFSLSVPVRAFRSRFYILFFRHVRRCIRFLQCRATARVSFRPGPFARARVPCIF